MRNEIFLHRTGQCSVRVIYDYKEGRIYDILINFITVSPFFLLAVERPL